MEDEMLAWSTNQWVILILALLAGMFIGMFLLAGGKWKRRYREEVKRREHVERDRDNWAARAAASGERITVLERDRPSATAAPVAAAAGGAVAGGILGGKLGRGKADDLSQIRGIGPNGQQRLHDLGIHRYKDLEKLDERQIAELEGGLGVPPGHVDREGWREQARLLREGKADEHARLYPQRAV
jgi:predicted flap endonuclease-1-like 5' DNA nuclease